ncbi:phosphoenolpyruvate carboxylase [Cyclobacterium marinum]|uniref:Phosphoenolpyruvate carboxylase n=1 Tax=Cyclobacterium marinum (strain ATCC 25205 / DSM 745 / LMG 13164 / NCIMB 1802) TaxID=880070 RepID=G0J2M5_CYCMS|nr:phosphoenolpyruvate carboxylase [Cyclobacterium marinum]AEL26608.1 phosphoenolpyruvate carboxylase [Cyclobacterium marinum DSM 745]
MANIYETEVAKRFTIYNSLFLDLPFDQIYRTGTLLPILSEACQNGFKKNKTPKEIIRQFFEELMADKSEEERHDLLFKMVQYIERQVVLFDSIEDASFEKFNDIKGKGTMTALIARAENDHKKDELIQKLKNFSVRLTLTAHPTQFYPGNVLAIITDLEQAIRKNDLGDVDLLLRQLGKTAFINKEKPSPYEEAVSLTWFLEYVFYPSISDIMIRVLNQLNIPLHDWENPNLLKVGFWPGGDRDGNPFVTHEITKKVADKLQNSILKCYYRDIRKVRRRLTFHNVESHLIKAEKGIYNTLFGGDGDVFKSKDDLLAVLYDARKGIIEEHGGLSLELLDEFILKVRVFGFHFASMDVRQDSRKHDALWDEILEKSEGEAALETYRQGDEEAKIEKILSIDKLPEISALEDPFHREMLESVKSINYIQKNNGPMGCHRYIISNNQSVLHVLEVFQLNKLLLADGGDLSLDIVPLFETIDDLANAHGVMTKLYNNKVYREHLRKRGNKQSIMLGFSDGTKDGGYIRANWSILRAKEELTKVAREEGIDVIFFDGRGGPPARGGGNTHNFYASLGPNVENREIQITIQGQTISANYGKPVSCSYNLEQLLSAGMESHLYPSSENSLTEKQKSLIDEMAEISYNAYKELKNHKQFVPYLEKVTPLKFFGMTNIGSRPVKRSKGGSMKFEDLRAIPFVGAWAQMKQNIPGFFGVGKAIEELEKQGRLGEVQQLYKDSLFFRSLLGNSMQSLAKSFYPATAYLKDDPQFGGFWDLMYSEYQRSYEKVLAVAGMTDLLEDSPLSNQSIAIRERIVLPLITIQQYAIQTILDKGKEDTALQKLILRTMFGIINAARNAA